MQYQLQFAYVAVCGADWCHAENKQICTHVLNQLIFAKPVPIDATQNPIKLKIHSSMKYVTTFLAHYFFYFELLYESWI